MFAAKNRTSIDATEALSSLGLKSEDPGDLAFLLINRSMIQALSELARESSSLQLIDAQKNDPDAIVDQLDFSSSSNEIFIDRKFLDRPTDLPILKEVQFILQKWLEGLGVNNPSAKAIADRLPSYFVYSLNQEWRKNAKDYRPIIDALDTPFAKAGEREWAWTAYSALLQHKINEGIFDEPFSLSQIYVPLNAFYTEEERAGKEQREELARIGQRHKRVVVSLENELEHWLVNPSSRDAIRVISGGPGSGKSSFARIFAARHSNDSKLKVLYVPLHLIDASKDLVEEIGRFVGDEGVLIQNPLDSDSPEQNLLIIFDGLDELASQGKAAAETARNFVREVERTVDKRNQQSIKLRVLISGRELIVQENESVFRQQRQILTLLPYFASGPSEHGNEYQDPEKLLESDLRQLWWKNYGILTGKLYTGLPDELDREDLEDVTAQPLLNYLLALSFARKKMDFSKDINLNLIYADLVAAVHERAYEKHPHVSIRHMGLGDFFRILEEIGLASWHGDGRTTTVKEIQDHCDISGLGPMLDKFSDGAEAGVTRLLAAFFFRKYGQRSSGDSTFVFTHKSFGEYLAARRIVRAVDKTIRELKRRARNPDEGWDEREALKHWIQICGPSSITPYLHAFLIKELKLKTSKELAQWQDRLVKLFSYLLRHGMPMEMLVSISFKKAMFQSRNAEEALLVALNSCATITGQVSLVKKVERNAFGEWLRRIQGQRFTPDLALATRCLSFLDLSGNSLEVSNFFAANLSHSHLQHASAAFSCFYQADLIKANLEEALLWYSDFSMANLGGANLRGADLIRANLTRANLTRADLTRADLREADLTRADLREAILTRTDLKGADLREANLKGANLEGANLEGANLKGAKLPGNFRFLKETG